jgi:hypothetical protein
MGEHRNTGLESASTDFVVSPTASTNQSTNCSCVGVFLVSASISSFATIILASVQHIQLTQFKQTFMDCAHTSIISRNEL